MKDYLFIYGTLLPEHAPEEIAEVVHRLGYVGDASVTGRLYDLGEFPGAILESPSKRKLTGQVFALPDSQDVLHSLDSYEEFNPQDLQNSLFIRKRTRATLQDGRDIECWIYVYNRDPGSAPVISSGDGTKFRAA